MGKFDRLDDPTIYTWTLNSNSTRYDYPRAWPSAHVLHIQFSILSAVNGLVATGILIFLIAYWKSPTVNSNAFNLYLFFVALPDFLASFFCLFTCAMSAPKSAYFSERMCGFQAFYLCWSFTSNAWLNGLIVYQVHKLLRYSSIRMRYIPPTKKQICIHVAIVYTYAAVWGSITSFGAAIPKLPHESHLYYGLACFGMEHDEESAFFFWLCFIPLYMGLPLFYVIYIMFDIWRRDLLPVSGRRRNISIFLLRLCFLYFLVWAPFLITSFVGDFFIVNTWLLWSGAAASHFQGLISVFFCMTNAEINKAVWSVVFFREGYDNHNEEELPRSAWGNLRMSLRKLRSSSVRSSHGCNDLAFSDEFKLCHSSNENSVPAFQPPLSGDFTCVHVSPLMDTIKEEYDADVEELNHSHLHQDGTCMIIECSPGSEDICSEYESRKMSQMAQEMAQETVEESSNDIETITGDASPGKPDNEVGDHKIFGNMGDMEHHSTESAAVPSEKPDTSETKEERGIEKECSGSHPAATAVEAKESPV